MTVSKDLFKQTVGSFPTGVTVTTAYSADGQVVGMTASAFSSVSLDPLLVLMCPAKDAECYSALTEADYFSIHLLAGDQGPLAWQFAKSDVDKTQGLSLDKGPNGSPKIQGCLAYLECRHHALYDGGDHGILVGEVRHIELPETDREPLVYCKSTLGPLPRIDAQ
ncbi:MAG: flavin reductase family protein [Litorivicinaceae bacterium]|jgi:3-hydroxy-9,10-secoandrosta-1,3,5(10)-triene-9,17-dione monooxygenase reductase component